MAVAANLWRDINKFVLHLLMRWRGFMLEVSIELERKGFDVAMLGTHVNINVT